MNDKTAKPTTPVSTDKSADDKAPAAAGAAVTDKVEDKVEEPAVDLTPPEAVVWEGSPAHRAVHAWVAKYVQDSPISRNTEVYNYVIATLPKLADMINEENKA